jgi:hypothetical protein
MAKTKVYTMTKQIKCLRIDALARLEWVLPNNHFIYTRPLLMKRKSIMLILLCLLISMLSACGQTGKLYLPEKHLQKGETQ